MAKRQGVMLAYKFEQAKFDKMPKPVIVQPKLNGNRCRALHDNKGVVSLLSSSEAPIVSMPHIMEQLTKLPIQSTELDGELYHHGWRHQKINGIVRRTMTYDSGHKQINYHIFDIVDESVRQIDRINGLRQVDGFIKMRNLLNLHVVESYFVDTIDQVMLWLSKFMEKGYEGIIIRDPSKPYTRRRTNGLLKLKPALFDTFEIIGYKKGLTRVCTNCGNTPSYCTCECQEDEINLVEVPLETLGAVRCKTLTGKTFYVGSGQALTDLTRANFWQHRNLLIGRRALVKYHELSIDGAPVPGVLQEITPKLVE